MYREEKEQQMFYNRIMYLKLSDKFIKLNAKTNSTEIEVNS